MKKIHKEFQFCWTIFLIFIPAQVLLTFVFINQWGNNPIDLIGYLIISPIFLICILLFYGMTVTIDNTYIHISFGIGLISKKIELKRIKSITIVKNPFYFGLGIKIIPNGMLYNVHGFNAVELRFDNTKKVIRIGSNENYYLKNIIETCITGRTID